MERESLMRRARFIGWLILAGYCANIIWNRLQASAVPADFAKLHLWAYVVLTAISGIVLYMLYRSGHIVYRLALIKLAILPFFMECLVVTPPNSGLLWWAIFAAGLGHIILLHREEVQYGIWTVVLVSIISAAISLLNPYVAIYPANSITHGAIRFALLSVAMGLAVGVGVMTYSNIQLRLMNREREIQDALANQEELSRKLENQLRISEENRRQAEAALAEAQRLRAQEQKRAEKEAFLSRYELLMRLGYTEEVPIFCQKVLDSFTKELPLLGGLFYIKEANSWRVAAAYGFPQRVGVVAKAPILRTAELTKTFHLIQPAPAHIDIPRTALLQPRAAALLYVPFVSEATQKTIAVAELLLASPPSEEILEWIEAVGPRLGTYLWMRLIQSAPTESQNSDSPETNEHPEASSV